MCSVRPRAAARSVYYQTRPFEVYSVEPNRQLFWRVLHNPRAKPFQPGLR